MLSVFCPTHRSDVLVSLSQLEAVVNTDRGIVVHWRCSCGTRGHFLTGATL